MSQIQPAFQLNRERVIDLSLENPDVDKIFSTPDVEQDYFFDVQVQQGEDKTYRVVILSKIQFSKSEKSLFVLEMAYAGDFTLQNVPEDYASWMLFVDCPHFIFPTVRHLINSNMRASGFLQFDLPNINFAAMAEEKMKKAQNQDHKPGLVY